MTDDTGRDDARTEGDRTHEEPRPDASGSEGSRPGTGRPSGVPGGSTSEGMPEEPGGTGNQGGGVQTSGSVGPDGGN